MKVRSIKEHKAWLERELALAGISNRYLRSIADLAARAVNQESADQGWPKAKVYFTVFVKDKPTRAWWYAAELALWLDYKQYPVTGYIKSLCHLPRVAAALRRGERVPLNVLAPSTRRSTVRLKSYADHYERWREKYGSKNK